MRAKPGLQEEPELVLPTFVLVFLAIVQSVQKTQRVSVA
jgi:hypothetical protein